MPKLLSAIAGLILAGAALAAETPPVRNLTGDFANAWDASRQLPMPERVAAMKRTLMALYPEFYGRGTAAQQDARLARAIEGFPAIRAAYTDKGAKFGNALQQHLQTFNAAFPDFRLTAPTTLLHSLGEMDGGTRTLGGKEHLIFGADKMAVLNPDGDSAPLFHHELFHVLHEERFQCQSEAVWVQLWKEGLAVYVSQQLNPAANNRDLLLDFPHGMVEATQAHIGTAWSELQASLDSSEERINAELFTTSVKDSALPVRRGYYLGYLIAKDVGKTRDLPTLARLDCKQVRELVGASVARLAKESAQ